MRVTISYKSSSYHDNMQEIKYENVLEDSNIGNIKIMLKNSLNIPIAEQILLIDKLKHASIYYSYGYYYKYEGFADHVSLRVIAKDILHFGTFPFSPIYLELIQVENKKNDNSTVNELEKNNILLNKELEKIKKEHAQKIDSLKEKSHIRGEALLEEKSYFEDEMINELEATLERERASFIKKRF